METPETGPSLRLDSPPRSLSPGMQSYLRSRSWFVHHILLLALALPGVVMLAITALVEGAPPILPTIGLLIVGLGVLTWLIGWGLNRRRLEKIRMTLMHGRVVEVEVKAITTNYAIQVNNRPQTRIHLELRGEPMEIGTFDERVIRAFSGASSAEVLWYEGSPDVMVPLKALQEVKQDGRSRRKARRMRV